MSAREEDPLNGWIVIKNNPLSKVGVFEYLGKQISPQLEPDKIYKVYRPAEELGTPETLDSFKLIPWTNDHPRTLFNLTKDSDSLREGKKIEGITTENISFDGTYLRGDIKIFTKELADAINSGKKELSIGYQCIPEIKNGVYNGEPYHVIQRQIRGNHFSTVDEGRTGPDVAVQDSMIFTYDIKDLRMENKTEKAEDSKTCDEGAVSLESLSEQVKMLAEAVAKLTAAETKEVEKMGDSEEMEKTEDADEMEKTEDADEVKKEAEKTAAMDAKLKRVETELATLKSQGVKALLNEVSKRDQLAKKLSNHIGVFDHADKTLNEVAQYGVKKLGLTVEKGHEISALTGFLAARDQANVAAAMDTKAIKTSGGSIDKYLSEGAE